MNGAVPYSNLTFVHALIAVSMLSISAGYLDWFSGKPGEPVVQLLIQPANKWSAMNNVLLLETYDQRDTRSRCSLRP
jgi:hypothetical protein